MKLPFDASWEARKLLVEVDEDQHRRSVAIWNKPTISGVLRDEQRRIYDERKRTAATNNGYTLVRICWDRKPKPENRDRAADLQTVRDALLAAGVDLSAPSRWLTKLFKRRQ